MDRLKNMKETLISCAQSQMGNLERVNAQELGEVVDMIKDLDEAMYYCSIVKAMEENEREKEYSERYAMMQPPRQMHHYYTMPAPQYYNNMGMVPTYYEDPYREMGYQTGRMYYSSGSSSNNSSNSNSGSNSRSSGGNNARGGGTRGFESYDYPRELRDYREGRSPMSRRGYMESKENHQGKEVQIKELEKYLNELAQDITEMIEEASPEEKQMFQQKLSVLANKMK